jgi:hypothetical protein
MTQRFAIKCFLLGLPIGLFLTGAGSLVWYFNNPKATEIQPENQPKSRPVSQSDLEFTVKRLAQDVGPRPVADEIRTRQAASFIAGSLGVNNMGYLDVRRETFQMEGRELANLYVEVPGLSKAAAPIWVMTHYDSPAASPGANQNASGVAANLALANLFLGATPKRTIRFWFLANGLGESPRGSENVAKAAAARGEEFYALWYLDSIGRYSTTANSQQSLLPPPAVFPTTGNFLALMGTAAQESKLSAGKSMFDANSGLNAESVVLPTLTSRGAQDFASAGLPVWLLTDTGDKRGAGTVTPQDTPDTLEWEAYTEVVRTLGRMLTILADQ